MKEFDAKMKQIYAHVWQATKDNSGCSMGVKVSDGAIRVYIDGNGRKFDKALPATFDGAKRILEIVKQYVTVSPDKDVTPKEALV